MKNGDISNVSSPQVVCVTDVVIPLVEEVTKKFLTTKIPNNVYHFNIDEMPEL